MSDAPRWPGTDGGPGLDFSSYRRDPDDAVAADDTEVNSTISPSGDDAVFDAGEDQPADVDAGHPDESIFRDPDPTETGDKPAEEGSDEKRGVAPVTPRAAERAARTAQEWAAMPVVPMTPPPAGGGATAAGAGAEMGAAGVAGGSAGAGAAALVGSPAPQRAPVTGPGGLAGAGPEEDADPLPLDEVAEAKVGASERPARTLRRPRRTRKARLRLSRIDPWSVMKTTFLFAIAFGIMSVVATFVLWSVLAGAGTLEQVNTLLNQLFGDQDTEFDVTQILSVNRILGFAAIVSAINVVIITALATLFAFLYNLAATVMGGLEVTLAED